MRLYKTSLLFLIVLFFLSCKKDWGTTEKGIYTPLDPPPASLRFDLDIFNIDFSVTPSPVNINNEAVVSINIARKDNQPIGDELYYNWQMIYDRYYYTYRRWYSLDVLYSPRINGETQLEGFGKNQVVFKTTAYESIISSYPENELISATNYFNPLNLILKIGYLNEDDKIKYFYSTWIEISLQY